jgi:hypothetical protein
VKNLYAGTLFSYEVSRVFLGLNMLLTGLCLFLGWKVDGSWRKHAQYILRHRPPGPDKSNEGGAEAYPPEPASAPESKPNGGVAETEAAPKGTNRG